MMDIKSFLLYLVGIFLIIILLRESLAVSLVAHEIFIDLDEKGMAKFTETFYLNISAVEREKFMQDVENNGRSLLRWWMSYEFIKTKFANWLSARDVEVRYDEENKILVINYTTDNVFAVKDKEETRSIRWKILESNFQSFLKGSTLEIPENTIIYIEIPKGAYIKTEEIQEGIRLEGNKIILQNIKVSNLNLYYYFDKPIAPPVGIEQIAKEFIENKIYQIIVAIFIALALIIYWKRKLVVEKIENFILKYSELSETSEH